MRGSLARAARSARYAGHGPSSPSDPLAAGTTDFLRLARKAGKQIVIATNAHRDVWQLKADTLDLARFVDVVVSSHDYGKPKEDQHFWDSIRDQLTLDLGRCAFFDDSEAVLASAQTHGVAVWSASITPTPLASLGY